MLASIGPEHRGEYLTSVGMSSVTKRTLTRRAELEEQLLQIGGAGVAFESEEFQPGLTCLAAPRSTTVSTASIGELTGSRLVVSR